MHQAAHAAGQLLERGHAVYVPHVNWIIDAIRPTAVKHWLRQDLEWIEACDAVLRLPGESQGADLEVAHAHRHGIPVYGNLSQLLTMLDTVPRPG